MTNLYCNQSLGTGSNNGADFDTNAWQTLELALNGSNAGDGDILYVKNNKTGLSTLTLKGGTTFTNDPLQVIACKTTATGNAGTPPTAAMILPGLRTGEASALAYNHADAPTLTVTAVSGDISLNGWLSMYGLVIKAYDIFFINNTEGVVKLEECHLRNGNGENGVFIVNNTSMGSVVRLHAINSKFSAGSVGTFSQVNKGGLIEFQHCIFDIPSTVLNPGSGAIRFDICDFSANASTILSNAGGITPQAKIEFLNCKFHVNSSKVTGSIAEKFRVEFIQSSSDTGKGTGASFREFEIFTDNGTIVEELTRVRTGGADDGGSGGWALKYDPNVNGTRDNREGLVGPWFHQKIAGDGTPQTLTVFIANDLTEDAGNTYDDDEVWLEVFYPSEGGTANYAYVTTQMDLLATPVEITTETVSTWGSGANNRQKLSVSIAPDYTGRLRWRVVFAKNFGATPDTHYVDPASEIT